MKTQVIEFNNPAGSLQDLNEWLNTINPCNITKITPLYNTILGGIDYVVEYLEEV